MCQKRCIERHELFKVFRHMYVPVVRYVDAIKDGDLSNWNKETQKDDKVFY